jgi:hypothetical protein
MTRTEERLQDALHASAARVEDQRLRPLAGPEPRRARARWWRAWGAPLAAAASVALVIGLVVTVTAGPRRTAGNGPSPATPGRGEVTAGSVPKYFAFFNRTDQHPNDVQANIVVLSTATGAEVARTPVVTNPSSYDAGLAAAPDDRTFYAAYGVGSQTWIYRFTIPAHGTLTPLTRIKGGVVNDPGGNYYPTVAGGYQLAVSPDGTQLALTVNSPEPGISDIPNKIVVINLKTGAQRTWEGGLNRPGQAFNIVNLSWAAGGRSLVFLAQWCDVQVNTAGADNTAYCSGANTPHGYRDAQVWSLSATTGGGRLDSGALLLRQSARYPSIVQAIAGPGGTGLTAVVLSGPVRVSGESAAWHSLAIDRISASGSLLGVDYRPSSAPGPVDPVLTWDPSGRYLIFSDGNRPSYAWVGQGRLHSLPSPGLSATGVYSYNGSLLAW